MIVGNVTDFYLDEVVKESYDSAIFASGYEARCIHAAKEIKQQNISKPIVFGFREVSENRQRYLNDEYYRREWGIEPTIVGLGDDQPMLEFLQKLYGDRKSPIKILIDYSSMSRIWYASLLNWVRYASNADKVTIDFVYSVAIYSSDPPPMVIENILAIPGCEGGAPRLSRLIAVFGLGLYANAAQCVLDRLEPDKVYTYLTSPGPFKKYPSIVRKFNKDLIDDIKTEKVLSFPIKSVEKTFRYLSELATTYRSIDEIVLIPMGPKPHVLAAMLVSMKFNEIACLRVSAERNRVEKVEAKGDIIVTRVELIKESHNKAISC